MDTAHRHTQAGFTLIELIIAIVIIGILASIAWPGYQTHVLKSHRSEAITALNDLLQAEENFYLTNRAYTTDLTSLGYTSTSMTTDNGHYQVTAATCSAQPQLTQCIQLTAAAQGKQTGDNNGNSGNLTLNSLGEKSGWE